MAKTHVSKKIFAHKGACRAGAKGQNSNILTQYLIYDFLPGNNYPALPHLSW